MPAHLALNDFLLHSCPTLDVRSPSEYLQGHLPGSYSFPLFSDEERARIGTIYKKGSKQEAIELGLILVQTKLDPLLEQAQHLLKDKTGRVLCWRGGMRSGFIARLLENSGHVVATLQGGYQVFRRYALNQLNKLSAPSLIVLGGLTGSGKTAILQALRQIGEQVIDLESLAHHRGSSFGSIGLAAQPSQEQFENELAVEWGQLNPLRPIWIEDESRLIGHCHLPSGLYQNMQQAPLFFIEQSKQDRLEHLMQLYGQAPLEPLLLATKRIAKRLGSQLAQDVANAFENGQRALAFEWLLSYYDKAYKHQIQKRSLVHSLEQKQNSAIEWALYLKQLGNKQVRP